MHLGVGAEVRLLQRLVLAAFDVAFEQLLFFSVGESKRESVGG